jgi:hypothetical protein
MKKSLQIFALLFCIVTFAQAPEKFSYQAVIRNATNALVTNANVGVKISILKTTNSGTVVYSESQTVSTNANGLISLQIGAGTVLSGSIAAIDWSADSYFIKTETDPLGGTSYTVSGTSQLLSVPYAMYSKSSGGTAITLPYSATVNNAGSLFQITNTGDGASVDGISNSTSASITAVKGTVTSTTPGGFSTAVRGINNGTGALGIGVWGSQNGSGWGVYGTSPSGIGAYGNASGSGIGVYANANSGTGLFATSSTGSAANISITNSANANNVIEASTTGGGTVLNVSSTTGKGVYANASSGTAIEGMTGSISSAGLIGRNATGEAIVGFSSGVSGVGAVVGRSDGAGYGVRGFNTQNGIGVIGQAGISGGTGIAGRFENVNSANTNNAVEIANSGTGNGLNVAISNAASGGRGINVSSTGVGNGIYSTSAGGTGVEGITSSISAAGVIGRNATGEAIVGFTSGVSGVGAVVGRSDGDGYGLRGFNTQAGIGVFGQAGVSGGTGRAARFENVNSGSAANVLEVANAGNGNMATFIKGSSNVARIDAAGKGFFNGGTQNSGADIAEAFDVEGSTNHYEPGDILVISTKSDRAVEKSSKAYSALVAGVYATKPGVLLTEENIDSELVGKVPMGVIGVIPTKVCMEGGEIKRGDLLVTSSQSGVAMKANPKKVKIGQVIGKALQDYNQSLTGKINVLVSIK